MIFSAARHIAIETTVMPTAAGKVDLVQIARGCGYSQAVSVDNIDQLDEILQKAKAANKLSFIEVKCAIGARANLGRPTTTPEENKLAFMTLLAAKLPIN